jgi:capsular exopolysaccharide synthesis family protein
MSNSLQKQNSDGRPNHHYNFYEKHENGLDPQKIISLLLRYKWVVLLFLLGGAAGAWFYADSVTPVYRSTGSLMITSDNHSPNDELSKIISQTTGYGNYSTLKNELQVLRSRRFSEQVAQRLLKNKPGNMNRYPIYWYETDNGKQVHASKAKIANRVKHGLNFFQPDKEAEVLTVSFESTSSKEAAKVVNMSMHNYIDQSKQKNRQATTATANFLENERGKLKTKLHDAEQALRNYMDATGIVQVDAQATDMVNQRSNVNAELQSVTLKLGATKKSITEYEKQLQSANPELSAQLTEAVGPRIQAAQKMLAQYEQELSAFASNNPGAMKHDPLPSKVQKYNKQIARLKKEITTLSKKLFTKDQKFTGLNAANRAEIVTNLQKQLSQLKVQRKQLETRKKDLTQQKNKMEAKFNVLPEGMVKLAKLKRNVQINEQLYTDVSKKYADISLLEQSQLSLGRIVDPAVIPQSPASPNRKIFLLLGIMAGGVLAAGFIAVREFTDNSVNNIGELKTIYMPSLSLIPQIEKIAKKDRKSFEKGEGIIPKEVVMLNNRSSIAAESIRRLKNNIIYQNGESPPKSIAITSPEKRDGKSTISANLAIAFAEQNYWTLVIDADFRRSKLHKYLGLTNESGLANYLNDEIPFEELLQETDLETLMLMTAGQGIDIPDILSNNHKFKRLLKKMEDVFDVIIIDTPPYGIISDSSALLKYAEATILLAQYQKTNKGMLLKTMEELKQIDVNVTNIVLNNFDHRKESSNYYGNGYYQALYSNYDEYL